jgi:hypothetical protein
VKIYFVKLAEQTTQQLAHAFDRALKFGRRLLESVVTDRNKRASCRELTLDY